MCFFLSEFFLDLEEEEDGEGEDADAADRERCEPAGDLHEAAERAAEEGLRAFRPLRCRSCPRYLLGAGEALRIRQFQVSNSATPILALCFF